MTPQEIGYFLRSQVRGAQDAIAEVCDAIAEARARTRPRPGPFLSLLLIGGKSSSNGEVAWQLAEALRDTQEGSIIVQTQMISDPRGYAFFRIVEGEFWCGVNLEGASLADAVRDHPDAVVRINELERIPRPLIADLDRLLADRSLPDSRGRPVDFSRSVIAMTYAVDIPKVVADALGRFMSPPSVREKVIEGARRTLPAGLAGGVDRIVVFPVLGPRPVRDMVEAQLDSIRYHFRTMRFPIAIEISLEARRVFSRRMDERHRGHRIPDQEFYVEEIQVPISQRIARGEVVPGSRVLVVLRGGAFDLDVKPPARGGG